ncbi:MAG: hypothetical protein A2W05_00420 [Candidatus Schekmanbacteria bacterium RBG_16_38_10]|uniref:DUF362 domain-containing protein n=1 Tax=Candidatus Schekmanbacteria bacterium RBG_16_38_10 TaxID=1817879 RepID=A0A1F7RPG2_9BACT|nr:MAG: hypothetical protein A2W05_00420 [Candidatus Schekmanbacteria bacterium RBG_16_38_10]
MDSRREFLKKFLIVGGMLNFKTEVFALPPKPERKVTKEPLCTLYRSVNGTPADNITKVIEQMGGIQKFIGTYDVVVIKPNVQWWNQGSPNLLSLKTFIDMIMERPGGFKGEVVMAENCHRGPSPQTSKSSGWAQNYEWNSDIAGVHNMMDLSLLLKKKYGKRYSTVHWIDVDSGGKRVFSPSNGSGYVYCDGTGKVPLIACDNGGKGDNYRATIMTYPVFSTDAGTIIDFKNGVWDKGAYTERPLRFINFAALNYHSIFCGATSAVKNYMGVTDISGGSDPFNNGRLVGNYYNFHSCSFNKSAPGPVPGMLGIEIGVFLRTTRKEDLNITSAEWVGLSSRIDGPLSHTRAVLACTDPVALDYHATKYLLYPNSMLYIHNPDNAKGPLHQYLVRCSEEYEGFFDEGRVAVKSYDFRTRSFQRDSELVISGDTVWGNSIKPIMKYFYLRYVG